MRINKINKSKKIKSVKRFFSKRNFIFLLGILLVISQIILGISITSSGSKIAVLEERIDKLSRENLKLKSELVYRSSFKELETKAQSLGFQKAKNILLIGRQETFAGSLK